MTVPLDRLTGCRMLSELTSQGLEAVRECAREVRFAPGERLLRLGEPPQRTLIVRSGLAKQVGHPLDGRERILAIFRPGDVVGPAALMDTPAGLDQEVAAMCSVQALAISRRDLTIIGRNHPALILGLAREVSRQLLSMTRRYMSTTTDDVEVRLSQLLIDFADGMRPGPDPLVPLAFPLTHEAMSQIVGASRPHVSTVLGELERAGGVRRGRARRLLVNPRILESVVENGGLAPVAAAGRG